MSGESEQQPEDKGLAGTPPLSPTPRTRLRRYPDRGRSERAELYDVLDEGLMCFVGAVVNGSPRVTPMVYGRIGDTLYLHGSVANQSLMAVRDGGEICVTIANAYGLVIANSLFNHSVNFRSAMIYGAVRLVTDAQERLDAMRATGDQLIPGRSQALPDPTAKQLAGLMVIAIPLHEASVKVRTGPPHGEPADYDLDIWAGVIPLTQICGEPEQDPKLRAGIDVPLHVAHLVGRPLEARVGTVHVARGAHKS